MLRGASFATGIVVCLLFHALPASSQTIDHLVVSVSGSQAQGVPFAITVTAKDAANATVSSSETVFLEGNPGGVLFDGNGDGTYSMDDHSKSLVNGSMTMNARIDASGDYTIVASGGGAMGVSSNINVPAPVFDHFVIDPIGSQTAGTPFSITIRAFDSANAPVTFTGTVDLAADSGSISPTESGNFVAGVATLSVVLSQAGSRTITVTTSGGTERGTSNAFTVAAGTVHHFSIAALGPQTAGAPFDVAITARDSNENTAAAFTGTVAISVDAGTIAPTVSGNFVSGVATVSVVLSQAGSRTITVTTSTSGGTERGTSNAFTVAAGTVHHFSIAALGPQTAGAPFHVAITARDSNENTATAFTGTVALSVDAGTIAPTVSGNFVSGVATVSVTVAAPGSRTITVTRSGGSETGTSNAFAVTHGPLHHFSVAAAVSPAAGTPFNLTLNAQDVAGNLVTAFTGTVALSIDSGTITPNISGNFAAGTLTLPVSVTRSGSRTITVTRSGGTESGSAVLAVTAGAVHHFSMPAASSQIAGVEFRMDVAAYDVNENLVSAFTGTVDLSVDDGPVTPAVSQSFVGGTASIAVTLTSAGERTITVRRSGGTESGDLVVVVVAQSLNQFLIAPVGSQTAGTSFYLDITARDQFFNLDKGFSGPVTLSSGGSIVPSEAQLVAGRLMQIVTLSTAGNHTITVQRSGGSERGTSNAFTVAPGGVHHFLIEPLGPQTAGVAFPIRVSAYDALNNVVTTFTGTTSISAAGAAISPAMSSPYTAGTLVQDVTVTQAGTHTLTVSSGSASGTATFTVAAAPTHHFRIDPIASQTAGVAFDIGLVALDIFDNIADTFGGTASLSVDAGSIAPATTSSFIGGRLTQKVSVTMAGPRTVSAGSAGIASGSSDAFQVSAASVSTTESTVTASPSTVPANGVAKSTVSATVRDGFGNAIGGAMVTLDQSGGNSTITPAAGTASSAAGLATFVVSSTSASPVTYRATVAPGMLISQPAVVTFTASPAVALRMTAAGVVTAGVELPMQITAVDALKNIDSSFDGDRAVVVTGPGSTATVRDRSGNSIPVGTPTTITFTRGVATVPLTARTAETIVLKVASGALDPATSALVVTAAALRTFVFESVPTTIIAGAPLTQGRLRAVDAFNNTASSFNAGTNPVALTLSATLRGTMHRPTLGAGDFVNGIASLAGIAYHGPKGSGALVASSAGATPASTPIVVTTGTTDTMSPVEGCRDYSADFTVTVTGRDLIQGSTIEWGSTPLTSVVQAGAISAVVPKALLAGVGTIGVRILDPFGNLLGTEGFVIRPPLQIIEASAAGGPFCAGVAAQFKSVANQDATFRWTDPKGAFFFAGSSPRLTAVNTQTSGTYQVSANAPLCNPATASVTIAVAPAAPSVITAPDEVRAGSRGNTASMTKVDGARYAWTVDGGSIASGQGTHSISWDATGPSVSIKATVNTGGTSGCSASATKTTRAITCGTPVAAVLASPVNGALLGSSKVRFVWNAVANATGYEVIARSVTGALTITRKTADTQVDLDLPGGEFNWSVVSYFSVCSSGLSSTRTVTVPRDPGCANAPAPRLLEPSYNKVIVGDFVTFRWTAVPGAIGYVVSIADSERGPKNEFPPTSDTTLTARVRTGMHFVWVQALFNDCIGPYGGGDHQGLSYSIFRIYDCGIEPKPLYGLYGHGFYGGVTTQVEWTKSPGATSYIVEFFNVAHQVILRREEDYRNVGWDGVARLGVTPPEFPTSFRVTAIVAGCPSRTSKEAPIKLNDESRETCTTPLPATATLRSPANGSTFAANGTAAVTLQWDHAPASRDFVTRISYVLLSRDGGPWITQAAVTSGSPNYLDLTLPPGKYRWSVKTHYNESYAPNSTRSLCQRSTEIRTFTVTGTSGSDCARLSPVLVSPAPSRTVYGSPVTIQWKPADVIRYRLEINSVDRSVMRTIVTSDTSVSDLALPSNDYWISVRGDFQGGACDSASVPSQIFFLRDPSCVPTSVSAPGAVTADSKFQLSWNPVGVGTERYTVQVSNNAQFWSLFGTVESLSVSGTSVVLSRPPGRWYYRVRAENGQCAAGGDRLFSRSVMVTSITPAKNWLEGFKFNLDWSFAQLFAAQFNVNPSAGIGFPSSQSRTSATFSFVSSEPWLVVTSGELGSDSSFGLTVDSTSLAPGENTAWLTRTGSDGSSSSVPVVVNISTPVSTIAPAAPDSRSLIVPVVAHTKGIHGEIRSDLTMTNGGISAAACELLYHRKVEEGTQSSSSWLTLQPGQTTTFSDVVSTLFGDEDSSGYLELRLLSGDADSLIVTSRIYTAGANGVSGQYVPVFESEDLAGQDAILTMIGIQESSAYRTNLGLVEAAGAPVSVLLTVFDGTGRQVGEFPVTLAGGSHQQFNGILTAEGIGVTNGRVEARVISGDGRVAAYASVVDNQSGDAMFVPETHGSGLPSTSQVIAGIGHVTAAGTTWSSDVWIYNGGTDAVEATLTYRAERPDGGSPPSSKITIAPGHVQELRDVVQSRFGITSSVGALHIATATESNLRVMARTHNSVPFGTHGELIEGRRVEDARGADDPAFQLTGVNESSSQRTNIGIVEVSGSAVTVAVTALTTDGTETTRLIELPAYGYVQLPNVVAARSHNPRVAIQVIGGEGKVVAYASVIEKGTNAPMYIPGQ